MYVVLNCDSYIYVCQFLLYNFPIIVLNMEFLYVIYGMREKQDKVNLFICFGLFNYAIIVYNRNAMVTYDITIGFIKKRNERVTVISFI